MALSLEAPELALLESVTLIIFLVLVQYFQGPQLFANHLQMHLKKLPR